MFKNKVVLITGGSRGIGRATAIKFAQENATLIVVYKSNKKAVDEVIKIISQMGGKIYAIQADVSKEEDLNKIANESINLCGKVDILVNNAGIVYDREFEDISYEESLNIIKTNMLAPLFLSQKIAPLMIKNNFGKIINVSSTSGMYDFNPGTADYAMSKIALQSLTKDLSMKYSPVINVNAVAPGWVNTDMNADLPKEFVDRETAKYHIKRWAEPEEIADAIVYLAGPKASYVTGQVLVLDGGHC